MWSKLLSGNKAGAAKAKAKLLERDPDYFKNLGRLGGKKTMAQGSKPKGFAADPERARIAGTKGGQISRRGKSVKN
jgi:general stress protein YciG